MNPNGSDTSNSCHCVRWGSSNQEFLTFEEVADLLRISRPTLTEIIKRGEIPARKVGNQWRFHKQTLIEYITGKGPVPRSRRHK
jgi:excisionase family DNA binding protein